MILGVAHNFPRLFVISRDDDPVAAVRRGGALGFKQALIMASAFDPGAIPESDRATAWLHAGAESKVDIYLELAIDDLPLSHPLVAKHPDAFAVRRQIAEGPVDPRTLRAPKGRARVRFYEPEAEPILEWWGDRIGHLVGNGVRGFFVSRPDAAPSSVWRRLTAGLRSNDDPIVFIANTTGISRTVAASLDHCGFDCCLSSLPWWDGRASWLVEEHAALSCIAPVIAQVAVPGGRWPASEAERLWRLSLACATGDGFMMPSGYEIVVGQSGAENLLCAAVQTANALFDREPVLARRGVLRAMTGPGSSITALLRSSVDPDFTRSILTLLNPGADRTLSPERAILARAEAEPDHVESLSGAPFDLPLLPGEARLFAASAVQPVVVPLRPNYEKARAAAAAPRIIIGGVMPEIDQGSYPIKRTVGETLTVEADIFADGHEQLAAELLFKAEDEKLWSRIPMKPLGNDRWRAEILLARPGRQGFTINAWVDHWGGFVRDLAKKRDASLDLAIEVQEGLSLLEDIREQAKGRIARQLASLRGRIEAAPKLKQTELLLAPELRSAASEAAPRSFQTSSFLQPVEVERQAARFASWYELFPRSQTTDSARPGKLLDVIERLPAIKRMGFDVLYFPPIHPIGGKNRKGRNNSLTVEPGDPGSPYAIGSPAGGHDAVNPELGTLEDFKTLLAGARSHGIEVALDFAIQCSPDHPWLKEHPGWFDWRPDGTIKYAENPPKKYEDIVNVDFYAPGAIPDLWLALRNIVLHWVAQGVKIFRVDNPHTKPLPFWNWMIADIRGAHPDVIFLAEAFTRPKLMYHLAKAGFSQSYTYFTWRHTKAELTEYLTELNVTNVREYFRPHFFVNTPDINPFFLQRSGRAGFLIRAALAATLSGLWGVYSGFELCEAEPLLGKEEYKDSEKYQIRPRDWSQPGNIISEITLLNRLRKAEPALQSHLGLTFYHAFNDQVLYYGKTAPGQQDKILVAVSLDPHRPQEADFEVPLWEWGLPDHDEVEVVDLLHEVRFVWRGKIQHVRLTPDAPYAIWRVQPRNKV